MSKKSIIYIILVIIIASLVACFYLTDFYKSKESDLDKIYTADDFPNALEIVNEEILQSSLKDLNEQYQDLRNGKSIYFSWVNVGVIKKRLGDNPGAEEAWLNAIDYDSSRSLACGNLADLYLFNMGEYKKAEKYYQMALNIKTNNYTYYHGLASLYRYNMTEKANLIEGIMIKGAEFDPSRAENYYMYLANYFDQEGNDTAKAKYYSQKTLEINPDLKDQLPNL